MTIQECLTDFETFHLPVLEYIEFNTLREKTTRLTTPSVVIYVKTRRNELQRLEVTKVVKAFISMCPSIDIDHDKDALIDIDRILILNSTETNAYSIEQRRKFDDILDQLKKTYSLE